VQCLLPVSPSLVLQVEADELRVLPVELLAAVAAQWAALVSVNLVFALAVPLVAEGHQRALFLGQLEPQAWLLQVLPSRAHSPVWRLAQHSATPQQEQTQGQMG